ncbi:hypothetical protein GCM10027280_57580 [Micromonospora polyrhachis]|uniref:Uncharacterized protein n=1 Tax=Micromonospora polyrhachis TaxID=1282883 RepID=A0A7W7WRZ4_9ACTN|nr:hypothetical protein [Micromonospora polyrhachis]
MAGLRDQSVSRSGWSPDPRRGRIDMEAAFGSTLVMGGPLSYEQE